MPRLQQDKFQVFVSHKHVDAELASLTGRVIEDLVKGGDHEVDCFVSGEDISPTADWEQVIRNRLATSHLLVLLYTTPDLTWDWCLAPTPQRIKGALRLVETEAEEWRIFDPAQVARVYGPEYESSGVAELGRQWKDLRRDLDTALGGHDEANLARTEKLLAALRQLNHEFTTKAAERYLAALSKD